MMHRRHTLAQDELKEEEEEKEKGWIVSPRLIREIFLGNDYIRGPMEIRGLILSRVARFYWR